MSKLESQTSEPLAKPSSAELAKRLEQLTQRAERIEWHRVEKNKELSKTTERLDALKKYLGISENVTEALDALSRQMFSETLELLQEKLTIALQEVLEQPIEFRATPAFKNNSAVVEFSIVRDGNEEDLLRGQGGSVHNILSVGLRIFALDQLDEQRHRRFLVLDEQDCWLRPELVPRLVKMVYHAAKELEFQVIMISHHDVNLFRQYADRIYRMEPSPEGVGVELVYENQDADLN